MTKHILVGIVIKVIIFRQIRCLQIYVIFFNKLYLKKYYSRICRLLWFKRVDEFLIGICSILWHIVKKVPTPQVRTPALSSEFLDNALRGLYIYIFKESCNSGMNFITSLIVNLDYIIICTYLHMKYYAGPWDYVENL